MTPRLFLTIWLPIFAALYAAAFVLSLPIPPGG